MTVLVNGLSIATVSEKYQLNTAMNMRHYINLIENADPCHGHQYLYHGSTHASSIREHGLLVDKSSTQPAIFLTDNPQLAADYAESDYERDGSGDELCVVKIDLKKLDINKLTGDYDHGLDKETWVESLSIEDQCMYWGNIPPEAIVEITMLDD